uniref:DnaJ-like protein n=1 Tax=Rhizophora mucronata TaxID=61149 RepID=A0A2P2INI2_RHIMU
MKCAALVVYFLSNPASYSLISISFSFGLRKLKIGIGIIRNA